VSKYFYFEVVKCIDSCKEPLVLFCFVVLFFLLFFFGGGGVGGVITFLNFKK